MVCKTQLAPTSLMGRPVIPHLAIQILAADCEQDSRRHVPIISRSLSWQTALVLLGHLTLLVVVALLRRHLAWEDAGSNAVYTDLEARFGHLGREHFVEMDLGGLGGVVGEVSLGDAHKTRDAGDVDDAARVPILVLRSLLQEGEEAGGHEVRADYVGGVDGRPLFDRCRIEQILAQLLGRVGRRLGLGGCNPSVVDQDAEALLAGLDLLDDFPLMVSHPGQICGRSDLLHALLVRNVTHKRDDLARDILAMRLHHPL